MTFVLKYLKRYREREETVLLFEKTLMPDYVLASFRDVTPVFMKKIGAKALISDIDNTLVPYETAEATDEIIAWVGSLREAEIPITFVSNNKPNRVERFNQKLGCTAFADVHKPSAKYIMKSCEITGISPKETLFLGDQLLTDVWAARKCGMKAAIVPPINDKKTLFFKMKRLIEKPYMKKFIRLH